MIHRFFFDQDKFVIDVNSGALHLVDEVVWNLLGEYANLQREELVERFARIYSRQEIIEAISEIELLVEQGLLFSPDPFSGLWEPPENRTVKALCLILAHGCNLQCGYCFAQQGSFGRSKSKGLMSPETGKKAIDFLLANSGTRRHVEVDFFGGEPLINFSVLQRLVAYGREKAASMGKEIKYTVTTNAVQLNESIGNYLGENGISVILSLDGRPEIHDRMRSFPGGKGSYDIVSKNISHFLKSHPEIDYYLRGTFTRHNLDFTSDILHMANLGFSKLSIEPVIAFDEEEYALREQDLLIACMEYERLTRELLAHFQNGEEINFYHFNIDLDAGVCLPRRLWGCGAGCEYLAVTQAGELYPCHQFVGRTGYLMGDVDRGIIKHGLQELFSHTHVYSKKDCSSCWARFYCGGGCHANAHGSNGSIKEPYKPACQLFKKRLECALYLQACKNKEAAF